ncbi:hypothetical protein HQ520_07585 [bacterium]|nr:hypothetical protein [bacterium]
MTEKQEQQAEQVEQQPEKLFTNMQSAEKVIRDMQTTIQALQSQVTLQVENQGPRVAVDGLSRSVSREEVDAFLGVTRPDTEFFCFNQFQIFQVQGEEKIFDEKTRRDVVTTALFLTFQPWNGAGSELLNERDEPLFPHGIGFTDLGANSEVRRTPGVDLDMIRQRIFARREYETPHDRIWSGESFRLYLESLYAERWERIDRLASYQRRQEALARGEMDGDARLGHAAAGAGVE